MTRYLLLPLALLLAACGSPAPVPEDHFYRLPEPSAEVQGSLNAEVILVEPFSVSGLVRERPIIFMQSADSVELERYHYHLWYESPGYMLQQHLADYLRSAGLADSVTTSRNVPPDVVISGELYEFMHIRDSDGGGEVIVKLELMLRHRHDRDVHWQALYNEQEAVKGNDMNAVAAAFGRALDRIYQDFLARTNGTN